MFRNKAGFGDTDVCSSSLNPKPVNRHASPSNFRKPRPRGKDRSHRKSKLVWIPRLLFLTLLLVLPGFALAKLSQHIQVNWIACYLIVVSLVTLQAYGSDKHKAKAGVWRIPEANLHLLGLIGGWPMAFVAQRIFWHKVSKMEFQVSFGFIVLLHQYLAVDYLSDWQVSVELFRAVQSLFNHLQF